MKQAASLITLILCLSLLAACSRQEIRGEGAFKKETRDVKTFTGLEVDGNYNINGQTGNKQILYIASNENLLPYINTDVSSGVLHVTTNSSYDLVPTAEQMISFSVQQFNSLKMSGACTLQFPNLNTETFDLTIFGSHRLYLSGKVVEMNISSNGSSSINAKDLAVDKVTIKLIGSGQIVVSPKQELNVEINGSGTVTYFGKEPKVTQTINGSGKVMNAFGAVNKQVEQQ